MAVVMNMRWAGVTPAQYDEVRDLVQWETVAPAGGKYHVAWFDDDGLRVCDVWDSAEQFQAFTETQLMPGVMKAGIQGEPEVTITPAHRVYDANNNTVIA
jgi:uncharacterized protein YodC (DUF2158 family)